MSQFKLHIVYRLSAVLLVFMLLTPSAVKFSHIFSAHEHEVCLEKITTTHLHESDIDCEFHKFKLGASFTFKGSDVSFYSLNHNYQIVSTSFSSSEITHLTSFFLRGPPKLV